MDPLETEMLTPGRQRVVAAARVWIGTPYRHRASLLGSGCDCLGLLRGLWRDLIGPEPEVPPAYSGDWAEASGTEPLLAAARRHLRPSRGAEERPGDVLIFRLRESLPAKHCAVVSGSGKMIHAQEGAGVREVHLAPWWRRRIAGVFEFPPGP